MSYQKTKQGYEDGIDGSDQEKVQGGGCVVVRTHVRMVVDPVRGRCRMGVAEPPAARE